jgi:hypothetical protein
MAPHPVTGAASREQCKSLDGHFTTTASILDASDLAGRPARKAQRVPGQGLIVINRCLQAFRF